mmetsp:Transcript_52425/g.170189  ORF Transcript_52425/g.170189 Transcript_52425/m.170189 type:complete len:220 (-) Transcript_52425:846-1505(-)
MLGLPSKLLSTLRTFSTSPALALSKKGAKARVDAATHLAPMQRANPGWHEASKAHSNIAVSSVTSSEGQRRTLSRTRMSKFAGGGNSSFDQALATSSKSSVGKPTRAPSSVLCSRVCAMYINKSAVHKPKRRKRTLAVNTLDTSSTVALLPMKMNASSSAVSIGWQFGTCSVAKTQKNVEMLCAVMSQRFWMMTGPAWANKVSCRRPALAKASKMSASS